MSLFRRTAVAVVVAATMMGSVSVAANAAPATPNAHDTSVGATLREADLPANAPAVVRSTVRKAATSAPAPIGTLSTTCWSRGFDFWSPNSSTRLAWQFDGNLVVYVDGIPRWDTRTWDVGTWLCFQDDGNLVVYAADWRPLWSSKTWDHPYDYLAVQNDGNVVIYEWNGVGLWDTKTWRR